MTLVACILAVIAAAQAGAAYVETDDDLVLAPHDVAAEEAATGNRPRDPIPNPARGTRILPIRVVRARATAACLLPRLASVARSPIHLVPHRVLAAADETPSAGDDSH